MAHLHQRSFVEVSGDLGGGGGVDVSGLGSRGGFRVWGGISR